jgi:hypothetical protein
MGEREHPPPFQLAGFSDPCEADKRNLFEVSLRSLGWTDLISPVMAHRGKKLRSPSLGALGLAVGFNDPISLKGLEFHSSRIERRGRLLVAPVVLPVVSFAAWLCFLSLTSNNPDRGWAPFLALGLIVFSWPMLIKLGVVLLDRRFAESMCLMTALYLVVYLECDDVLANPRLKILLLRYMDDLARNTLLIALKGERQGEGSWTNQHFSNLASYIRKRQQWVIAPMPTTLGDLRSDFYQLAAIYLAGNYGAFVWPPERDQQTGPQQGHLVAGLLRILGFIVPLAVLALLIFEKGRWEILRDVPTNTLWLILIAWVLLSIDTGLKLGVVSSVIALAKSIRELK